MTNNERLPVRAPRSEREPSQWELTHRRVTFYCPQDLLEEIENEMTVSGRSKSRVIVDALREHLYH